MIAETNEKEAHSGLGGPESLILPVEGVARIEGEAISAYPEECCGVLLGEPDRDLGSSINVTRTIAARNEYPGDRRRLYEIDPEALLEIARDARAAGEDILGFYHSHPNGSAEPSRIDLETDWPQAVQLIVAVNGNGVTGMRCWKISTARTDLDELQVIPLRAKAYE